ncbi:MAG TPA: hypothetical protein EYP39_09860 [Ghiorsea sp.]|nr:hypothetical protein [Ghiorsea sp.]
MSVNFEDALKAKKLRDYFNEQGRIYIVVDAISDDVQVPDFLRGDPALRLVLNTRMPQPIYIRDGFVESNFSFSGVAHHCVIPLGRIWAAYVPEQDMGSGLMWEDSVPETVKMVLEAVDEIEQAENVSPLQVVQPAKVGERAEKEEKEMIKPSGSKDTKRKNFGHLRIVK